MDTPFFNILSGLLLIAAGILALVYRDRIGAFTGYCTGRGAFVDKPTPGWMLIPFALALIACGALVVSRSL